ncbi:hypothetical protein OROMI_021095 [Orobanche minor]
MCTNLRCRMMVAIMTGEPVNWCQIILRRLQEEVAKSATQKKSFGLVLNNILALSGVRIGDDSKSIGSGKYIGGYRPVSNKKKIICADHVSHLSMPVVEKPRVRAVSSPLPSTEEPAHQKKKKPTEKKRKVSSSEVERPSKKEKLSKTILVCKEAMSLQGTTPVDEAMPVNKTVPEPEMATTEAHMLVMEETGDSAAHSESNVVSFVRIPISV